MSPTNRWQEKLYLYFIVRHLTNIINPITVYNHKSTENPKDVKCMIMMETINVFEKQKT